MKKGFTTFLSALKANTPPCKKGLSSRKFLSLFLILFLAVGNVWAAYTPTADEVIILNEVYKASATDAGYSTHAAIAWAGTASTNSKKAGDPAKNGELTGSNVNCFSVKGNGGGKNITVSITGCSKIIVYHEKHSSRYVELKDGSKSGNLIGKGTANTSFTEVILDGGTNYSLFFHGTTGSDDQDFNIYAIKLIKDNSGADPVLVTGIAITPSPASVKVGKTRTLSATVTPDNATDKAITWAVTSGETYASVVEATGVVTGLAVGTATITATAHDGSGVTQTVTVNVEECPTSGTIYKFQLKTGLTNGNLATSVPTDIEMTTENYLSNLTGGTLTVAARNNVNRVNISNGNAIGFANGDHAFLKMDLDCAIQAGDILKYDITSNDMILMAGSETEATNRMTLSRNVTQVEVDSKLVGADALYMKRSSSSPKISYFEVFRPVYRTITLKYADGVTADGSISAVEGAPATKPTDPTWEHHRFDGWYNDETLYDWTTNVTGDLTLTAHWTQLYTISFAAGEGGSGDAPAAIADKAAGETFTVPANTFTAPTNYVFENWSDGVNTYDPEDTYTVGTANVLLTANWRVLSTLYAITEGTHTNGSITISPASQEAGETVTLTATPDADYLFSAWEIVKTSDGTDAGVTVTNGEFTMPAFAVTVNATFVPDTRKKVLYVTSTAEATVKENDKLYDALKDIYNVSIVGPASETDQTNYDLVVLHESVGGGSFNAAAVAAAKGGAVPVLNTKSFFYNNANTDNQRWNWGTPNAGQSVKGATQNNAYCNIASHPLFAGVTVTDGFFEITDDAAAKCMQPIGEFTSGKEGYTLATTPNDGEGNGCAIHELTPEQRGASAGKYLMISVSNSKLDALNANGQKLFQNAAAYLIGSSEWTPVAVPTSPVVAATPTENYTEGGTITLTASAEGTSASTVYTWYKGATLEEAGAIQAAKTIAENGNVYSKAECVVGDAGTYWCVISNGTSCDAQASVTITVSSASTPTHTISYDNVKGADMTAYPTEYTEGIGVASFDPLADITGWHFVEWNPASIATDATTDQTITAVWAQVFEVTFNYQGHGAENAKQDIISGEKATEPTAPSAIGYDFGGWFTDAACTNVWDFANDVVTEDITLYAKWTKFDGCVLLVPATSGDAPASKANVELKTGSYGGKIIFAGAKDDNWAASFAYTENGLALQKGGADSIRVQLDYQMKVGTKLTFVVYTANNDKDRGFYLKNSSKETKSTFAAQLIGETMYTYTVEEGDGLAGNSVFILGRNQTAYLKSIKVTNCGGKIVSVNYAITPTEAADKATVTLSANTSVEGQTITATYSNIASGWDFDKWEVNGGATMDDAQANPVTITMGAENPTVTLVLKPGAIKYTVSFDAQGGSMVEDQLVEENGNPILPAEPTKEDYIFKGWAETADGAAVDITLFAITAPKTFYAIWESDGAIKLLNGATVNHTNFITGVTADETVEFKGNEVHYAKFAGTVSGVNGVKDLTRVIAYNATTNKTKIQISAHNNSTNSRNILVKGLVEGASEVVDLATIALGNKEDKISDWIEFNNAANRTIYIFVPSSAGDVYFTQVKVIESGETQMKMAGEAGYSLNFNKGRFFGVKDVTAHFEGLDVEVASSDCAPLNTEVVKLNNTSMSFTLATPLTLTVTTNNNKTYYVTKGAAGTDNETAKTGASDFNLTAGTWYITGGASNIEITNIAFSAPKCEQPTVVDMENIGLCEGDAFTALTVSASVTDGGTLHYQWYKHPAEGDDEAVGTDEASYTPEADGQYYVVVTNQLADHSDNSKASNMVTVEHFASAEILSAPENVRMDAGETATLAVVATGKNVTYQWYKCDDEGNNATEIVGATADSYEVTVGTGVQYYKVVVSSGCGEPVKAVVKVEEWTELPLADVTGSITWNFANAVTGTVYITGTPQVLANYAGVTNDNTFESNKLEASGEKFTAGNKANLRANYIHFHTTVPGMLTINYSNTGSNSARYIYVNGAKYDEDGSANTTPKGADNKVFVPAGDVELVMMDGGDASKNVQIYQMIFNATPDYTRDVTVGSLGTICLPSNVPAGHAFGATFYTLAGKDANGRIAFNEVTTGELAAGVPYLFQAQSDVLYCFYGTENVATPDNSGAMKGTFVNMELDELSNIYYFADRALWSCVDLTKLSVPANRAYVNMAEVTTITEPAPVGVRRITLGVNGQNTATGVDQVQGDNVPTKMIINSQLFILRGEKMYDAQGKLVR